MRPRRDAAGWQSHARPAVALQSGPRRPRASGRLPGVASRARPPRAEIQPVGGASDRLCVRPEGGGAAFGLHADQESRVRVIPDT